MSSKRPSGPSTNCPTCHLQGKHKKEDRFYCTDCMNVWSVPGYSESSEVFAEHKVSVGTLIEHPYHGIGAFAGETVLSHMSPETVYLELEYQDKGKVFVPMERAGILKIRESGYICRL